MFRHLRDNASPFFLLAMLVATLGTVGCWDRPVVVTQGGFFVTSEDCGTDQFGVLFCIPHPNAQVNGRWVRDLAGWPVELLPAWRAREDRTARLSQTLD
jgi:hypothetical protein